MKHRYASQGHAAQGRDSFARFYLEKVAISEGCGCAEMVIRRGEPKIHSDQGLMSLWRALRQRWRSRRHRSDGIETSGSDA